MDENKTMIRRQCMDQAEKLLTLYHKDRDDISEGVQGKLYSAYSRSLEKAEDSLKKVIRDLRLVSDD